MNLLLDSQTLLWALHAPARLTPAARAAVSDSRRAVYYSAASARELEIKAVKGKLTLPVDWLSVADTIGFLHLPVTASEARLSARLPWHDGDPFDRILVAQAISHGLHLATRDPLMSAYDVPVLAV